MKIQPFSLAVFLLAITFTTTAEPRFRADDGNLSRLADNPALSAASGDLFSLGAGFNPEGADWNSADWNRGTHDLKLVSPLLVVDYSWKGSHNTLGLGGALGPWQGFSAGYRRETSDNQEALHHFGTLYRPYDFLSVGATLDNAFGKAPLWGTGLSLRRDWLTLSSDVSWAGSTVNWERVGARMAWQGSDVRVWFDPATRLPGFEVTLSLGPMETSASPTRVAAALRWSTNRPGTVTMGKVLFKPDSSPAVPFGPPVWNVSALLLALQQAADNPQIAVVVLEDPPATGGLASAQELRAAVDNLRKVGKKVYIHADSYNDSLGFQSWISAADRVSVDPTGSVWLTSGGSRRLYFRDLFEKIGVKFVNLAPWETKSANNSWSFASMPDGERAMLKRFLTDRDDLAAKALASGRGDRLKGNAADLVAQGPYLVVQEALEKGLVDVLENRADFEEFLAKAHPGASMVGDLPPPVQTGWGPSLFQKTVALVHLTGDIVMGRGQMGQSIGRAAAETLKQLREDAAISAVVLRVDSPGGAVLPSDALAEEVKKTVAAGKPVVVVMGDAAASGGYYLSAPATRIFALPGTLTGSIGVTAALFTGEKALELLGIRADGVDLGPSAGFGDWTRTTNEVDRAKWDAMIAATYQRFLDVVSQGRHLEKSQLEPLARGQIYTGREALALGLVDELGGQSEAKAWLEKELGGPVEWQEYHPGEANPLADLLAPFAASLKPAGALDLVVEPWVDAFTRVMARGPGPQVWVEIP